MHNDPTTKPGLSASKRQETELVPWPNSIDNAMAHIHRRFQQEGDMPSGLPTGLLNIDKALDGLENSTLTVLGARPAMGKTSLAMNIAECVALGTDITGRPLNTVHARPHPVAFFSIEMTQEALTRRMLCGLAGVPAFKLNLETVDSQKATQRLTHAASQLKSAPIYVDDTGALDVMEIRARSRRMKKKYGIELIIVDYLQLANCRDMAHQGRQLEVAAITAHLKAMAKELKIPVLVLSQLSRAPELRGDRIGKPRLSDLRDSGAIEEDADVVLLLRRPSRNPGDPEFEDKTLAIVDIAKHRNGPTGEVRLTFDEQLTRFGDRTQITDQANPEPAKVPAREGV